MRPYSRITLFAAVVLLFTACELLEDSKFKMSNEQIGLLPKDTPADEIEKLFAEDSVVEEVYDDIPNVPAYTKWKVFEKGGELLLTLTPSKTDSLKVIEHVRIEDPRYTSEAGISLESTFGDLQKKYSLKKITPTLNNVVVFVEETELYFSIDKEELPESLRYGMQPIEAVQIPADAKIKYIMMRWD